MKKLKRTLIVIVVILVAAAGAALVTCPDKQAHKDAIMAVINEKIEDELQTDDSGLRILSSLFGTISSGIAGNLINNRLVVKNHFLWSTGEITGIDGVRQVISVGVFGHVFTFSKEDLDKALENVI